MNPEWLSFEWFNPFTLINFEWENVYYLYFIFAIPVLYILRWVFNLRYRQKVEVALSDKYLKWHPESLLRFVPNIFMSFFLLFLFIVIARPQRTNEIIEQTSEGINIILALDISESMLIEDFKPNRLDAAKKVAVDFINGRTFDRIGIVIFSGEAYSLSPLTTDYGMLKSYLEDINHKMILQSGTAIGSALGVGINRLREASGESKVIILLSDGDNTAGNIDPLIAAKLAQVYKIKIYSILVGMEGKVPYGKDLIGNIQYIENTIDETTLKEIAKTGDGKFFRASNNTALAEVFQQIDKYEKTEIKENRFQTTKDYYHIYLIWAIIFYLLWLLSKSTFMVSVLED